MDAGCDADAQPATAAATTALLAYLDAKLQIRKDLRILNGRTQFYGEMMKAGMPSSEKTHHQLRDH